MDRPDCLPPYLTPEQRAAVLHRGSPLLIIAGPGSGKTEVIACRVAYLVQAGLVRPENVLAITFTNRAALELKDRIHKRLDQVNVELMQVSTIHSFCADLLRRYRHQSVFPRGFNILDETAHFAFVYGNRKALGLDALAKGRPQDILGAVIRAFDLATEEMVEPDALDDWCRKEQASCCADQAGLWVERALVTEAYRRYSQLLLEQALSDFAFLQRHAITLVEEHPDVLAEVRQQYQEVLVDEYQDTNAAQDRLLELIAGDGTHLTVVGDDDQSIYRFRGATVRNILTFKKRFPNANEIILNRNFRSPEPIVEHSQRVITHNPARFPKELVSARFTRADIRLIYEGTADQEARAVVSVLRRLHQAGKIPRHGDVAILLRSVRSYAGSYVQALQEAGIPYHVIGEPSFFEREEIAQLYNLFNFLAVSQPHIDIYLRQPIVGLGKATCEVLEQYQGRLAEIATAEGLEGIGVTISNDRRRLLDLLALKQRVQAQEYRSQLRIYYDLLAATGCVTRYEKKGNAEVLANLGKLSTLIGAWDEIGVTRNYYPFRQYLEILRNGGMEPVVIPPEDAVQVMTIHQAKGLEFPVVVLGAAMKGRLPTQHRRDVYEIPHHVRASGRPEVDDPHTVDERKLFYVAATRARDLLLVGTANVVNKKGGGPSPFVYEMFGDNLHAAADQTREYVADVESRAGIPTKPRARYSFSQLAYYLQCPMRYKFAEVYGLQPPWPDPVYFGANVHRALDEVHERARAGHIPTERDAEAIVAETWVTSRRVAPERDAKVQAAAVGQVRRYLREHRAALTHVFRSETPFAFTLGETVLLGKIDLLRQEEDGRLEVVDFKTSASVPVETENYDLQLDLYALGAEASLGQVPVARHTVHFLGDGQVESQEWSRRRADDARSRLEELLKNITAGDFPPRMAYCPRCQEYNDICPYARASRRRRTR